MKKYVLPLVTTLFIILILGSCKKDCNCDVQTPDIYGSWTVLQTDDQGAQYNVELKFNSNNSFDWILLDSVAGHTNSYVEFTLSENIMTISDDPECGTVGEYYIYIESDKLALITKTDECGPRVAALEWVWNRK